MKCCKVPDVDRKKVLQVLGLTALCTVVSVFLSIVATIISKAMMIKRVHLKQTLQELFPEYDWEFTGTYQSLKKVVFTIYFQPGFVEDYPDAEAKLREALLEKCPALRKVNMELVFRHREDFPTG